ncbi:hypothetical protein YC2023_016626 [Brassica napus]
MKGMHWIHLPFLSVERKSISSLSVNNDQVSQKNFSSDFSDKKKSGIPHYSELNGIIGTSHYNFIYSAIFHENSDLLAKRQRNRFLIPFQSIQEQAKEFIPHAGISIEIPINGIFRRNNIFAFFFYDPRYIRKSSGILKYGTLKEDSIVQKEDMIEYRGVQKFKTKYEMKVDRFFFIPEEVHILPESSAIMVQNYNIIGVDTRITLNIRSQLGGLIRVEKKKGLNAKYFRGISIFQTRQIRYPDIQYSSHKISFGKRIIFNFEFSTISFMEMVNQLEEFLTQVFNWNPDYVPSLNLLDFWILRSPLIHDIVGYYDHRKDSLQVNQPIPCMGLTQWLEQRHIWLGIPM